MAAELLTHAHIEIEEPKFEPSFLLHAASDFEILHLCESHGTFERAGRLATWNPLPAVPMGLLFAPASSYRPPRAMQTVSH